MIEISNTRTRLYLNIAVHIATWALLLNVPLLSANYTPNSLTEYIFIWIPLFSAASIFYINFFYLIPKLLFIKKTTWFFIINTAVYTAMLFLLIKLRPAIMIKIVGERVPDDLEISTRLIMSFLVTTGIAVAIRITSEWFRSETVRKELEQEHLKSELSNLKNQLNPHFFFNTLNTIYGLIPQNTQLAQDVVYRLGKLMRYHLYESNEFMMPLAREIEFINTYVELMKVRVASFVVVESHFPVEGNGIKVAPLLFIPLIENSFKHGISPDKSSSIKISLEIVNRKKIMFVIQNTSFPKKDNDRSGSGIGLENLQKRLGLLYPGRHSFSAHTTPDYYTCSLILEL